MNSGSTYERASSANWETWVAEHVPRLLLFARQQSRSEEDAQDLVQEAVMECWNSNRESGPPRIAQVFATIRLRAIDLARKNERRAGRESTVGEELPHPWFDAGVEHRERLEIIEQALKSLPDSYREVITLKVWGDLTFAEIGDAVGIPPNTAASRYRYALAELRKLTKEILA